MASINSLARIDIGRPAISIYTACACTSSRPLLGTAVAAWVRRQRCLPIPARSRRIPVCPRKRPNLPNLGDRHPVPTHCKSGFPLVSDRSLLSRNPTPNRSNDQGAAAGSLGVMEKPPFGTTLTQEGTIVTSVCRSLWNHPTNDRHCGSIMHRGVRLHLPDVERFKGRSAGVTFPRLPTT